VQVLGARLRRHSYEERSTKTVVVNMDTIATTIVTMASILAYSISCGMSREKKVENTCCGRSGV